MRERICRWCIDNCISCIDNFIIVQLYYSYHFITRITESVPRFLSEKRTLNFSPTLFLNVINLECKFPLFLRINTRDRKTLSSAINTGKTPKWEQTNFFTLVSFQKSVKIFPSLCRVVHS